jgi:hypothetical protein
MTRYRYVSRPRAWQDDYGGWQDRPTATVYEPDDAPQETGLLDALGNPLFRVVDRAPLGFDLTPPKPRIRIKAGSSR